MVQPFMEEIRGRPVLRPANVALRSDNRVSKNLPKSPPLKPAVAAPAKVSPPNSQPSTPRVTRKSLASQSPKLPSSQIAKKPSPRRPCPCLPPQVAIDAPLDPHSTKHPVSPTSTLCPDVLFIGSPRCSNGPHGDDSPEVSSNPNCHEGDSQISSVEVLFDLNSVNDELLSELHAAMEPAPPLIQSTFNHLPPSVTSGGSTKAQHQLKLKSSASSAKASSRISLIRSTSEVMQRSSNSNLHANVSKSYSSIGGHSFDETSLVHFVAAKKAAASETNAQRRLKVAEYGRKVGISAKVAPDVRLPSPMTAEPPQRCKFITAQSDPLHVAYHDQEWGVPVHDDRSLFELLVLAGAQAELSWTAILHRRDAYRAAFCTFDAATVALFTEKRIQSLEVDKALSLAGGKIRGVVENAKRIVEVIKEFGSLDNYLWAFINNKPMNNGYRSPKQVPAKTSKSEFISKDLVRRGFRHVGPTVVYSFMQAAGMTNDHLIQCFRHQACETDALLLSEGVMQEEQHNGKQDVSPHTFRAIVCLGEAPKVSTKKAPAQ